ncbi:MAG: hypothetical protein AAFR61_09020 [Bacteroidota bacterium]
MKNWSSGILCLLLLLGMACSTQKSDQQNLNAEQSPAASPTTVPVDEVKVQENIARGMLGDSTMFPFVWQGEGRSLKFEAYTMRFSLTHSSPLVAMTNDLVQWVKPDEYSENNGVFIHYFRNGRPMKLTEPYVRVEYINKNLPYCGTVDSIYLWLDGIFIERRAAQVYKEAYKLDTQTRAKAECKEYYSPPAPGNPLSEKYAAYAYIDYDSQYLIGLNMTVTNKADYDLMIGQFKEIAQSFALF